MKFYVSPSIDFEPPTRRRPCVVLIEEDGEDYGFNTLYSSRLLTRDSAGELRVVELGQVKVLEEGLREGRPGLPAEFTDLKGRYCSLGQTLSYYEALVEHLTPTQLDAYLRGLRDVVIHPRTRDRFERTTGFEVSLALEGSASRAMEDAPDLLWRSMPARAVEPEYLPRIASRAVAAGTATVAFSFQTDVGGDPFQIDFKFDAASPFPSRCFAIIGYNGTGKTQLLARLARVTHADLRQRPNLSEGSLVPSDLRFGAVIAVSFSAFDTFERPQLTEGEQALLDRRGEIAGYVYCGLRRYTGGIADLEAGLKNQDDLIFDLERALKKIDTARRRSDLTRALRPLYDEPSFERSYARINFFSRSADWRSQFRALSTGHQISLTIIVLLVAHLERRSLVLIDEPESHLHPPLLSALISGINAALTANASVAVIATHSPVVLQEIPRSNVRSISRVGEITRVIAPRLETFGENVGVLTQHVFNLDNTASDYRRVLAGLAERFSLAELDEALGGSLSAQARAILVQLGNEDA